MSCDSEEVKKLLGKYARDLKEIRKAQKKARKVNPKEKRLKSIKRAIGKENFDNLSSEEIAEIEKLVGEGFSSKDLETAHQIAQKQSKLLAEEELNNIRNSTLDLELADETVFESVVSRGIRKGIDKLEASDKKSVAAIGRSLQKTRDTITNTYQKLSTSPSETMRKLNSLVLKDGTNMNKGDISSMGNSKANIELSRQMKLRSKILKGTMLVNGRKRKIRPKDLDEAYYNYKIIGQVPENFSFKKGNPFKDFLDLRDEQYKRLNIDSGLTLDTNWLRTAKAEDRTFLIENITAEIYDTKLGKDRNATAEEIERFVNQKSFSDAAPINLRKVAVKSSYRDKVKERHDAGKTKYPEFTSDVIATTNRQTRDGVYAKLLDDKGLTPTEINNFYREKIQKEYIAAGKGGKFKGDWKDITHQISQMRGTAKLSTSKFSRNLMTGTYGSLMGGMGFIQASETSQMINALGWGVLTEFTKLDKHQFRGALLDLPEEDLNTVSQGLSHFFDYSVGDLQHLRTRNLRHNDALVGVSQGNEGVISAGIDKYAELTTLASGANYVRRIQSEASINYIFKTIADNPGASIEKYKALGITPEFVEIAGRIQSNGKLNKNMINAMKPEEKELLIQQIDTALNTIIQDNIHGESLTALSNGNILPLLLQFMSFPIAATSKQVNRVVVNEDKRASANKELAYKMAVSAMFSALVVESKNAINQKSAEAIGNEHSAEYYKRINDDPVARLFQDVWNLNAFTGVGPIAQKASEGLHESWSSSITGGLKQIIPSANVVDKAFGLVNKTAKGVAQGSVNTTEAVDKTAKVITNNPLAVLMYRNALAASGLKPYMSDKQKRNIRNKLKNKEK